MERDADTTVFGQLFQRATHMPALMRDEEFQTDLRVYRMGKISREQLSALYFRLKGVRLTDEEPDALATEAERVRERT